MWPDEIALGAFHEARDHDGKSHSDRNADHETHNVDVERFHVGGSYYLPGKIDAENAALSSRAVLVNRESDTFNE
jgi:hypothetical protein